MPYDSRPDTQQHISKVQKYLTICTNNLFNRGQAHDQSKLHPPELAAFDEMTPILSTLEYGSPEYKESTAKLGDALKHHYANNSHHPEHFKNGIDGMSLFDLVEMVCDWKAASERTKPRAEAVDGEREGESGSMQFSLAHNAERHKIDPQLQSIFANTFRELGWK